MTIYKDSPCVFRITELDQCYPVTVCDDADAVSLVCQQTIRGEVGMVATTTDDKTYTLPADCKGTVTEVVQRGKQLKWVDVTMNLCSVNKEMEVWLSGQKGYYDGAGDTVVRVGGAMLDMPGRGEKKALPPLCHAARAGCLWLTGLLPKL